MGKHYDRMIEISREASAIDRSAGLISWDQETLMPVKAAPSRGRILAVLSGLAHSTFTSAEMGEAIRGAEAEGITGPEAANVREIRRRYDRFVKVPIALVREMAETSSIAKECWREARAKDDFPRFAPMLRKTIELKKRYAEAVGYEKESYDALIEDYEPGMTAARLSVIFDDLRNRLVPLTARIRASQKPPRVDFLSRLYEQPKQEKLSRQVLELIGFDFEAGRLDTSTHPFTSGSSALDVRVTTRYDEHGFPVAFFGTMHEGGHGLYEQGLPVEHEGTPLGEAVSLGIHESQSRLWENMVGRGRPFCGHVFPLIKGTFPESLGDVTAEEFYRAVNEAKPSLIRVEADEVYYNLHIIVRFEMERDLFRGVLQAEDTPAVWRKKMQEYVGITPPTDREGVLQDIHWSMGLMGYFPTYSLGNLYAAQIMSTARREIPDLDERIGSGDTGTLLAWLRGKVHVHGMRWRAGELIQEISGQPLDAGHLVEYLEKKYGGIYGF